MTQEAGIHSSGFIADDATVLGDVTLGEDCSVWFHATLRGDRDSITVGKGSNIQDNAVVHVDRGFPVVLGENVTVGHGALIHGCRIGDNTLVGMGAIVMDGARVGRNCILGAGTLVPQNRIIPDGSLVIGSPGKIIRKVTEEEVCENRRNAQQYAEEAQRYKETQAEGKDKTREKES